MKEIEYKKLEENIAQTYRKRFINKFVNQKTSYYVKYIKHTDKYIDGECYLGYLWSTFKKSKIEKYEEIERILKTKENIIIFWDINTKERIFIEDYWKFGKETVMSISVRLFLENTKMFPEDIYIFDETFNWYIALTHEEINKERYCLIGISNKG